MYVKEDSRGFGSIRIASWKTLLLNRSNKYCERLLRKICERHIAWIQERCESVWRKMSLLCLCELNACTPVVLHDRTLTLSKNLLIPSYCNISIVHYAAVLCRRRLQTAVPEHPDMITRLWKKEEGVRFWKYMYRQSESVERFASGWTVRGSNPSGGDIFRTRPDRPWGPQNSCTVGTGSLSRG
jgi:hypothetical protein